MREQNWLETSEAFGGEAIYKPCLPSLMMGNVRMLANKEDELTALAKSQRSSMSVVCALLKCGFSRIYPTIMFPLRAFSLFRPTGIATRAVNEGGLAVLVNNRWYNPGHITIKDFKLFAIGIQPYYLSRQISYAIVVAAYIC